MGSERTMGRQRSLLGGSAALAGTLLAGSLLLGGALALAVPVFGSVGDDAVGVDLPEPELKPLAMRSVVYDAYGGQMAVLHSGQNRAPVDLDALPPTAVRAVLAAEDRDFFEHDGVDWRGIGRALVRNLDAGAVREGGSTITQQLVKNTLFDQPTRDLERKVKEAVLAVALENRYTKHEILEAYLDTIYLGHGAYGVRAASERYFGVQPEQLDLAQSALLAALIANPEGRDPVERPADAARARASVLDSMVEAGWATEHEAEQARAGPLPTSLTPLPSSPVYDPFVEEVKRQLLRDERLGSTYEERYRRVFEGGLRIYTTYDPILQSFAEQAVDANLPPGTPYTATLVAIENDTGAVRAMVPGNSVANAGFNLATQGTRQTGSAFKAITLAAALEAGFSPDDRVNASGECRFRFDDGSPEWNVHNYDGRSMGNVSLTTAIANSSNCAFARVVLAIGAQRVVDVAHRLGIERPLQPFPSITLGAQAVSPLDMATAFSTIAADGVHHPPRFVERVEAAGGDLLFEERPEPEVALQPETARTLTHMLREVIDDGTGTRADIGRPAAGKTGTNQAYRDAWFVGYTPQLTASVWIGNRDAQVPVVIEGTRVTGGSYPARIWHDFMQRAHEGLPVLSFPEPDEDLWPRAGSVTQDGRSTYRPRPRPRVPEPPPAPGPEQGAPAPEPPAADAKPEPDKPRPPRAPSAPEAPEAPSGDADG